MFMRVRGVSFGSTLSNKLDRGSVNLASVFDIFEFGEWVFLKFMPMRLLFHQMENIFGDVDFSGVGDVIHLGVLEDYFL